jgi:hypothetical protein
MLQASDAAVFWVTAATSVRALGISDCIHLVRTQGKAYPIYTLAGGLLSRRPRWSSRR